jgi:hypothetical protein
MKQFRSIFNSGILYAMVACLFLLKPSIVSSAPPPESAKKTKPVLNLSFGLKSMYDDNILKYSDEYIRRFLNQEDNGRFRIETYDDVVLIPEINLDATFRLIKGLNTTLNAEYRLNSFIVNHVKSRSYIAFGVRQYFTRKASVKLSYSYIPDFYIRHFRDDDWVDAIGYTSESFKPFSFSKNDYNFEVQHTLLKKTRLRYTLEYAQYYYNQHFTEYDCNNIGFDINIRQSISKRLKAEVGFTYTQSKAKGYDEPGETRLLSDDSDGSYNDNLFLIRALINMPDIGKLRNRLDVRCETGLRYFTSGKLPDQDKLHVGRTDHNLLVGGSYEIDLSGSMDLALFYNWVHRRSDTEIGANKSLISMEKDYDQHQIGLSFIYKIKL